MLGGISPNITVAEPGYLGGVENTLGGNIAPGITATAINPLPIIPAANISLPAAVDVTIATVSGPETSASVPKILGNGGFKLSNLSNGRATIDLDGGYWLNLNEYQSEVMIENRNSGMETRIWGAGQVAVNGNDAGQFFGTTSFELANGAKITIETGHDLAQQSYYLDRLTVTKAERAVIISGVDDDCIGDLSLDQSNDGIRIEDHTRDGFVLVEEVCTAPVAANSHAATANGAAPTSLADVAPMASLAQPLSDGATLHSTISVVTTSGIPVGGSAVDGIISEQILPPAPAIDVALNVPVVDTVAATQSADTISVVPQDAAVPVSIDPASVLLTANPSATTAAVGAVELLAAQSVAVSPLSTNADTASATAEAPQTPSTVDTPPKIVGGWASEWGDILTTKTLQTETGIGGDYGPGSDRMSLGEVNVFISSYIVFGHVTSLWSIYEMNNTQCSMENTQTERTKPRLSELESWLMNNPGAVATRT